MKFYPKVKEKWLVWCKELPLLDNLRIPRLVLDSTNDEVSDLTLKFTYSAMPRKLAYGAAAYVKVRKQNEVLDKSHHFKSEGGTLKAVTIASTLSSAGALVAARLEFKGSRNRSARKRSAKCSTGQTPK
ncbi:hypothetical protein TNCV_2003011 [Trichonephila clavipes]|nr:hypothetical protein TNCV_2003011 [Trichonephila clavipes]